MPTKKKARPPRRADEREPQNVFGVPGLTGRMKPAEAIALLDRWAAEHDPDEDAAVLKALQEEFAAARQSP